MPNFNYRAFRIRLKSDLLVHSPLVLFLKVSVKTSRKFSWKKLYQGKLRTLDNEFEDSSKDITRLLGVRTINGIEIFLIECTVLREAVVQDKIVWACVNDVVLAVRPYSEKGLNWTVKHTQTNTHTQHTHINAQTNIEISFYVCILCTYV